MAAYILLHCTAGLHFERRHLRFGGRGGRAAASAVPEPGGHTRTWADGVDDNLQHAGCDHDCVCYARCVCTTIVGCVLCAVCCVLCVCVCVVNVRE